jgi:myo-inositol 2-dehydrogenase / D-chiro-inositol 1-dehydrogenase
MGTPGGSDATRSDGPFRLGLIGAGRMGRNHLQAIGGSPTVRVTGVVDADPDTRAAIAATGIPAYASLDELLAAGQIDGALIAVPTNRHVTVLESVVGARLPVLCEKPCGLTVDETRQCASAARRAGVLLQVAYWRRFVPELGELRQQIRTGELGDILAVNCYQWDGAPPSAEFRGSSGGIFIDMGVHEFDQVRWLTGQEFTTVHAVTSRDSDGRDPDCAQLVAALDGGSTAMVSLGRWHPAGDSCKVEVFGTKGTVSSWFLDPVDGDTVFRRALQAQAEAFAGAVRASGPAVAGQSAGSSADDALAALSIASEATAQANADSEESHGQDR